MECVAGVTVTVTNLPHRKRVEDWLCLEQPERQEPILLKGKGLHKALLD